MKKGLIRFGSLTFLIVTGIVFSLASFRFVKNSEDEKTRHQFQEISSSNAMSIENAIKNDLGVLYSITAFFRSSVEVSRNEFDTFSTGFLQRKPGIQALEWIPRVRSGERETYERMAEKDGLGGLNITEKSKQGKMVPAGRRGEYFPVYYVTPLKGNEKALGFDLGSNAVRLAALEKARDSGELVVSGRIKLVQETGDQYGVLAFLPRYRNGILPGTVAGRRDNLLGFVLGVFRVGDMLEQGMANRRNSALYDIYLLDSSAPPGKRLLHFRPSGAHQERPEALAEAEIQSGAHATIPLSAGGRDWTIVFKPIPKLMPHSAVWAPTATLFAGLAFTSLLSLFHLSSFSREKKVGRLVVERTHALEESGQRIRAVVDNIFDGIVTIDGRGVIQSVNQAVERIFGYRAADLVGRNVSLLAPEPHRGAHDGYLAKYLKTGEAKIIGIGREVEGQRKNGKTFPMELAIAELELADEHLFLGVVRDITERKAAERMKGEFISTVSHELRTPLTSIQGSLGMVMSGKLGVLPDKVQRMIDLAQKNAGRLVDLVNDLLDMEQIQSGSLVFKLGELDVSALMEQALEANRPFAEEYGVEFVLTWTVPGATIAGDARRLTQVMANLLSNAAKFSPKGEKVEVSVVRNDDMLRISVVDHGPGIPEDFRDRLFERFTQADSSDTRQKGGTGLGLNITRAIVEKHGGHIGYHSEIGKGATFYFDLPELKQEEAMDRGSGESPSPAAGGAVPDGARVLILEDDRDVAEMLSLTLGQNGFIADIAYDAARAKELLAERRYHVMTVDIMLPDQDGISLIRELRLREDTKDLAIIVLSAVAELARQEVVISSLGVIDWIDKPIDESRLLAAVKRASRARGGGKSRLLYVEDDGDLVSMVTSLLAGTAEVVSALTLRQAKKQLRNGIFDLMILDIGLPDGSGLELLPLLKNGGKPPTPVIVFSAEDIDGKIPRQVEAALVKSRTSNEELLTTVRSLIGTGVEGREEERFPS